MKWRVFQMVVLDHLPFWFIMACVLAFAGFDIWSQINGTGIYAK